MKANVEKNAQIIRELGFNDLESGVFCDGDSKKDI